MASSEYGGAEDSEILLEEGDVYKATTSSDYVVVRRVRLYRSKFITYHNIEENENDNKQWILTSQCELQPRSAADIKEPATKYVRPRGQWAITTFVKPKSIGSKGQPVKLYMFTICWPTRWAAKGYTSFSFGFTTAEAARQWHGRLAECLEATRLDKPLSTLTTNYSLHTTRVSSNNATAPTPGAVSGGGTANPANGAAGPASVGGGAAASSRVPVSAATTAAGSVTPVPVLVGLSQAASHRMPCDGPHLGLDPIISQMTGPPLPSRPPEDDTRRVPATDKAKRTLVYDNGGAPATAATASPDVAATANTAKSSFFNATAAASVAAGGPSGAPANAGTAANAGATAAAAPPPRPSAPGPSEPPAAAAVTKPKAAAPAPAAPQHHHLSHHQHHTHPPQPPRLDVAFSPSSSDSGRSDGDSDDIELMQMRSHGVRNGGRGSSNMLGSAAAPCRAPRGTARGDVRHTRQRWVPYKQVNGVAIYHRPQTAGDAEAGVGGEFMVSTVVRGSPRRCLTALTANCGNTTILGPAITLEVLQPRQAVDGKEVQRIVLQAPGVTGVICAPREIVIETVFKTDDTGPTLVLMFNSCEAPAPGARQTSEQQEQQEVEVERVQTADAFDGGRRSWWRRPVTARVRGGYTIAPLEEYSLDNSPEALVTCIMKVDLGGVCGERSWLRLAADLVGWTDAFLDRMLMAVTLLRDEVEQGRFVLQPLSMMSSYPRIKEREVEDSSAPRRVGDGATDGEGFGPGGAAATRTCFARRNSRQGLPTRTSAGRSGSQVKLEGSAGSAGTVAVAVRAAAKARKREAARPSLVDVASGLGNDSSTALTLTGAATAVSSALDMSTDMSTAESGASGGSDGGEAAGSAAGSAAASTVYETSPVSSPSVPQYESLEDVLRRMKGLSYLDTKVWDNLHRPGKDAPFKIRGPTYLKDRKKIPAGYTRYVLGSMDVIQHPPGPVTEHVARFIPAIRQSGAPFSLIIHLVIPGTPLLGIVATFVTDRHPSQLGTPPAHPMEDEHEWEPFDFVLHKYMTGSTHTRNHMLKLIPHIADGSWMIKQSVGTTPVILGKQLRTIYYETPQYMEIDIDISANNVASYVTGLVRGATRSLVIDMGFVLEGTTPWELPEALLGTLRLYNLDIRNAKLIDVSHEIPLRPSTLPPPPSPPACAAPPSAPPSCLKQTPSLPPQAAGAAAQQMLVSQGSNAPLPPAQGVGNGGTGSLVGGGGSGGGGSVSVTPISASAVAGVAGRVANASHRRMLSAPPETLRTPAAVGQVSVTLSPAPPASTARIPASNGGVAIPGDTSNVAATPAGGNSKR